MHISSHRSQLDIVDRFNRINSMKFNSLMRKKEQILWIVNSQKKRLIREIIVSKGWTIGGKRFSNVSSRIERSLLKVSLLQYRRLCDFSAVGRTRFSSLCFAEQKQKKDNGSDNAFTRVVSLLYTREILDLERFHRKDSDRPIANEHRTRLRPFASVPRRIESQESKPTTIAAMYFRCILILR